MPDLQLVACAYCTQPATSIVGPPGPYTCDGTFVCDDHNTTPDQNGNNYA